MRASYQAIRDSINMDGEITKLRKLFTDVKDKRASNSSHKLEDILMGGYVPMLRDLV